MLADRARPERSSASASTTATTSRSRAPEVVLAAIAAPHRAHPPRLGRHGAQLRRPDPRLRALRDARRRVERAGRGHPRPRLVHRVVPAVRLRPRPSTRSCSPRSSTCSRRCSTEGPVTWSGTTRAAADRPARVPHDRGRVACGPGSASAAAPSRSCARPATAPADARDHRRRRRPSSRPYADLLPASRSTSSGSRALPIGVHSPGHVRRDRRAGARASCGRTSRRSATASAASAAGRPPTRDEFEREAGPEGAAVRRLARDRRRQDRPQRAGALGVDRFDLKYSNGTLPHDRADAQHRAVRDRVAPRVRDMLG